MSTRPRHSDVHSFYSYHFRTRELLLLEAVSLQGLGNWQAIAEHIGTRTKDEVEDHYKSVYVNSPNWPLPVCYVFRFPRI